MSICSCTCGWSGDSKTLVAQTFKKGTPEVYIELNRCPKCNTFVPQEVPDEDEEKLSIPNAPFEIRLPQLGPGWI